jgi:hypothetical protein
MTGGHVIFWYYEMGIEFDLPQRNLSSHVRITPKLSARDLTTT